MKVKNKNTLSGALNNKELLSNNFEIKDLNNIIINENSNGERLYLKNFLIGGLFNQWTFYLEGSTPFKSKTFHLDDIDMINPNEYPSLIKHLMKGIIEIYMYTVQKKINEMKN